MSASIAYSCHSHAERGHDLYETPEVATEALLRVERLPINIWEPACGPGAIVRVLNKHHHRVYATDIVDYGSPCQDGVEDFLTINAEERWAVMGKQPQGAIVTNPPFKLAQKFVARALQLADKVCMLMRIHFLESERRTPVLENNKLARVHVFRNRLPMMHRAGWDGPRIGSSAVPYAWFVWDHDHCGPAVINRISWVPSEEQVELRLAA